jgi:hypothetical protein
MRSSFFAAASVAALQLLCMKAYAQPANDNACGAVSIPVENLGCEPIATLEPRGAAAAAIPGAKTFRTWMCGSDLLSQAMAKRL